ncbi:hypothetical protein PFISCL1PPCAC_5383, partial [Pristionchus fissidentatus]
RFRCERLVRLRAIEKSCHGATKWRNFFRSLSASRAFLNGNAGYRVLISLACSNTFVTSQNTFSLITYALRIICRIFLFFTLKRVRTRSDTFL